MKKKNQNGQKPQSKPVKTSSSEKATDKVDFPPELAEFLGESLRGLAEQMGMKPNDEIPDDVFRKHFAELFKDCDIKKILHELKCDDLFNLQEDYDGKFFQSADEEDDVPTPDDFTDDEMSDMDFSDLEKDEYGNTLLSTIVLAGAEEGENFLKFIFPALPGDKVADACHLVVHIHVPYIDVISREKLDKSKKYKNMDPPPRFLTQDGEMFYLVSENTYNSFIEAAKECGVTMDDPSTEIETASDFKAMMKELMANGKAIQGIDSNARKDGYYEDLCEYWYDGKIYHEKDIIWFDLPKLKSGETIQGFMANIDHYGVGLYTPVDITNAKKIKVEGGYRVLSNEEIFEIKYNHQNEDFFRTLLPAEEVWYLASEFAKNQDSPGYCVVCRNGRFNVPIESFMNYETFELDELIVIFNALPCFLTHHKCASFLVADVGNMQMKTAVRFLKGRVFDWGKRIDQELAMYRKWNPDFDPYEDPYSDPNNSYIDEDGDDE